MFCSKCGRENKEGALFCEYCGTQLAKPQAAMNNSAPAKQKKEKAKKASSKKEEGGRNMVLLAGLIALIIMSIATGVLIVVGLMNRDSGNGKSYYKSFKESDVVFPDDGEAYVESQLLITVDDSTTEDDLKKVIKSYGGKIVGFNEVTNTYQVEFSKKKGDDLLDLKEEIAGEGCIVAADLNYVYYNEALVGSGNLDGSLMGIANSDYDDSLVGELQVALIGTAIDKSGIGNILADADVSGVEIDDRLVSLYGWECEVANKADEGCELFEISSKLTPTFDEEKAKMMDELNAHAAEFVNSMKDMDYNFMMLSAADGSEPGFIDGITDPKALEQILSVGAAADAGALSGVDVFAEGDASDALEYATTIAIMTWLNNIEMSGGNLKDVLANSYADPVADGLPGVLDADLSTEISKRLREIVASATDAGVELTAEDVLKIVNEVKTERGIPLSTAAPVSVSDDDPLTLKLAEIVAEKGYASVGDFNSSSFDSLERPIGPSGNYYKCNYSETGVLAVDVHSYFDSCDCMTVIINEEDGIYAECYENNGTEVVQVGRTSLSFSLYGLILGEYEGETAEDSTFISNSGCDYFVEIGKSNGTWKLITYYKYCGYDTNVHTVSVYELTNTGINFIGGKMISASIFVGGELEGEDSGVYVVDKDQSGSATSDFTPLTWENGMAQFNQGLIDIGVGELVQLSEEYRTEWQEQRTGYYSMIDEANAVLHISASFDGGYTESAGILTDPWLKIAENSATVSWWRTEAPEEEVIEEPEVEATATDADYSAENERFRAFFENEYATLADELYLTQNSVDVKYAYGDLDGDGTFELLIGDDDGIYAVVSEAGGAYQISKVYGWMRQYGAVSSEYIGNGCILTDLYLGNNYGGESGVKTLWNFNGATGQTGIVARLSDTWATDTPSDELPKNCWDLYVANDESNAIYDEEIVKSDPGYSYSHDDYGEYYNRDTEQYENECSITFNSIVDAHRGEDSLSSFAWSSVNDFN